MRINVYAEEMTDRVEIVQKGEFTGVRFWLELPVTVRDPSAYPDGIRQVSGPFVHHPGDDDSAAVTFWGKAQLRIALQKALALLESHDSTTDPDPTGRAL